ncbi:ATP-binding protein [Caldicoprobacter algeriensis]|uniref:ATP-binding protein n=1 Tax=Caldicoprobacter algeriensis TaxID=699281 RepID=UPI002079DCE6|nr:ATP-binding protein [Caldicoprobacter algeriensis]MCM8900250.1 ATP-binding protein [Caldicoprobacter algeriensis]
MKIAVLSGKGGTGKTAVSVSLAALIPGSQYVDCDVEEPNGYIFLRPRIGKSISVELLVPTVDVQKCTGCGLCARVCQFNAIAVVRGKVLVFPEICHYCGACTIACPEGAIKEVPRQIGVVEISQDGAFIHGRLNTGESTGVPIVDELKRNLKEDAHPILDCPPGVSCSVVHAIEGCDYCILVTEPTPFGLYDLEIAVKLMERMGIPFGVVTNKASEGVDLIDEFCEKRGIDVLVKLPFSVEVAKAYSQGILPIDVDDEWRARLALLYEKVKRGSNK